MGELWRLPQNIATYGEQIDFYFILLLWVTGIVFVGVWAVMAWFLVKYRHRDDRRAEYIHGNTKLEYIWTGATAVVVFAIGLAARPLWLDIKEPSRFPTPGLELEVAAKQFEWNVTYPGPDGRLGTADDFVRRNELHVPVGTVIRFDLTSEDVIHSFYVPELRLKQDAVPGMRIPVWFEATTPGTYTLGCAELCGLNHYSMRATLTVHTRESFADWQAQFAQTAATTTTIATDPAPTTGNGEAAGGIAAAPAATHRH